MKGTWQYRASRTGVVGVVSYTTRRYCSQHSFRRSSANRHSTVYTTYGNKHTHKPSTSPGCLDFQDPRDVKIIRSESLEAERNYLRSAADLFLFGAVHARMIYAPPKKQDKTLERKKMTQNDTKYHKTTKTERAHLLAILPEVKRRYGSDALPLHQLRRVVRAVSNHLSQRRCVSVEQGTERNKASEASGFSRTV